MVWKPWKAIPSICLAPVNKMLCFLAAAHTLVADRSLVKRHTARANAGYFLNLVLTLGIAAPHCTNKSVAVFGELLCDLIHGFADVGALFTVCKSLLVKSVAHSLKSFCRSSFEVSRLTNVFSLL